MNKKRIVLYIMVLLIVSLIAYLVYNYITNYINKNDNTINTTDIDDIDVVNYNVALYNNHTYVLPKDVLYSLKHSSDDTALQVYNNIDKWGALIRLVDRTKTDLLFDNYDELEKQLKNYNNYDVKNRSFMESENDRAVSFEMYGKSTNYLLSYMPAYDNYEYEISLYDGDDKSMNYTALYTVLNILKTGVASDE